MEGPLRGEFRALVNFKGSYGKVWLHSIYLITSTQFEFRVGDIICDVRATIGDTTLLLGRVQRTNLTGTFPRTAIVHQPTASAPHSVAATVMEPFRLGVCALHIYIENLFFFCVSNVDSVTNRVYN